MAPLPGVRAKGKTEPVAAWQVVEAVEAPGGRPTSHTPLVGRDRELALLDSAWQGAVEDGRPHVVTIVGPAGVGKSRIAREAAERIERRGGRAFWGRSLPYEEQTPYRGVGRIIRRVAGIYENDPPGAARAKLGEAIDSLFPPKEAAEATRFLSLILGLGLDDPPDEAIHLQFTMRMFVEHLAEREPLLLVFEDVHWAGDAMIELIDYVASHVRDARVMILALARPEFLESPRTWGGGRVGQTTLPLEPLAERDATAVVASLLPAADRSTIERVVSVAEGNPLFLEELVASMTDDVPSEELPTTVRAAIAARIDALPSDTRAALLHASVIGQSFWRGVLDGMGDLKAVDEALEGARVARADPAAPAEPGRGRCGVRLQTRADPRRGLRHVARAAPGGTSTRRSPGTLRRRLADPEDLAWVLAHHWRQAGELDAARGYLLAAAERARAVLAVEQTYDLFARALELATTDEERRRIRLRRGLALTELEDFPRADQELAALLPELSGADELEALIARSRATTWTEQADRDARDGRARAVARALRAARRSWRGSRSRTSPGHSRCEARRATSIRRRSSATVPSSCGRARSDRSSSPSSTTCRPTCTTGRGRTNARSSSPSEPRRSAVSTHAARSSSCEEPACAGWPWRGWVATRKRSRWATGRSRRPAGSVGRTAG